MTAVGFVPRPARRLASIGGSPCVVRGNTSAGPDRRRAGEHLPHGGESTAASWPRYTLRVVNHTGRRIECVILSTAGDAVTASRPTCGPSAATWSPLGSVDIDGCACHARVARIPVLARRRFVPARHRSARDVGVIGVAVFRSGISAATSALHAAALPALSGPPWARPRRRAGSGSRTRIDGPPEPRTPPRGRAFRVQSAAARRARSPPSRRAYGVPRRPRQAPPRELTSSQGEPAPHHAPPVLAPSSASP